MIFSEILNVHIQILTCKKKKEIFIYLFIFKLRW